MSKVPSAHIGRLVVASLVVGVLFGLALFVYAVVFDDFETLDAAVMAVTLGAMFAVLWVGFSFYGYWRAGRRSS